MTAAAQTVEPTARFRRGRFDLITITFHWLTVILVTALFAIAWSLHSVEDAASAEQLLMWHRTLGVTVWVLTIARLTWRRTGAWLPPFPPTMPTLQQWVAKASEYALYALLIAQPVTGMAQTLTRGRPFPLVGIEVPALMAKDKALTHLLHDIHEQSANALLLVIGLHAFAGLLHGLVLRDGVLQAMFPWTRSERRVP